MMRKTGKLTVTVEGDRDIVMTLDFNAPRELVFEALTKPELVKRWLSVRSWTMDVCEIDLRVGGKYRYIWRGPKGEMGMGGVFREIVQPERIVATERFDDPWYPGEALGTSVLNERRGITTLTTTARYESKEARDGVFSGPMDSGVAEGYDRLEELLVTAAAEKK